MGDGSVYRVRLRRAGRKYRASLEPFVRVPGVVDVVVSASERAIYACSYDQRKIYRIVPQ